MSVFNLKKGRKYFIVVILNFTILTLFGGCAKLDISGNWVGKITVTEKGKPDSNAISIMFSQKDKDVTGVITLIDKNSKINMNITGVLIGEKLTFKADYNTGFSSLSVNFSGTAIKNEIKGNVDINNSSMMGRKSYQGQLIASREAR